MLSSVKEEMKESEVTMIETMGGSNSPELILYNTPDFNTKYDETSTEKKGFCLVKQPSLVSTGPKAILDTYAGSPTKSPFKLNPLRLLPTEIVEEETRPASTRDSI